VLPSATRWVRLLELALDRPSLALALEDVWDLGKALPLAHRLARAWWECEWEALWESLLALVLALPLGQRKG
jgi:hypothetical protein